MKIVPHHVVRRPSVAVELVDEMSGPGAEVGLQMGVELRAEDVDPGDELHDVFHDVRQVRRAVQDGVQLAVQPRHQTVGAGRVISVRGWEGSATERRGKHDGLQRTRREKKESRKHETWTDDR